MSIEHFTKLYINGEWVEANGEEINEVINPATEEVIATFKAASEDDVNKAIAAAKAAFKTFSKTTVAERVELLEKMVAGFEARREEFAQALTDEIGCPITLSRTNQTFLGIAHLQRAIEGLKEIALEEERGDSLVVRQPAGVAGLITPWNWPINQVFTKVGSALAAGCTMVLKPADLSPIDSKLFAEVIHEAGVPAGVFNLVFGPGSRVGKQIVRHPDVDVVSFTGSTRAGRDISAGAAETIKTVHLELGGKSPNIFLEDADKEAAVERAVEAVYRMAGQSCSVNTRLLVPREQLDEINELVKAESDKYVVGSPDAENTQIGPLVSAGAQKTVTGYIEKGIEEGATVLTGGLGRPEGVGEKGYYVKPTVFTNVDPKSTIAQEEIFGPVLSIIPYDSVEEAIDIANDTIYGLAGVVESTNREKAVEVAREIRSGHVYINGNSSDYVSIPFGGWKQSGSGYEHDKWGVEGFQLIKGLLGARA